MRIKPYTKRDFAEEIVEIFEDLLDQKGIKVPCSDSEEETERQNDDNCACLYGMEYWNLVNDVEEKVSFYYECGAKKLDDC